MSRFEPATGSWADLSLKVDRGALGWVAADGKASLVKTGGGDLIRVSAQGSKRLLKDAGRVVDISREGHVYSLAANNHRLNSMNESTR